MAVALHFDVLDYVEKAEKLGVPNAIAKFQAREMESLYVATVDKVAEKIKDEVLRKELATKLDIKEINRELKNLDIKIEKYRYDSLKFIVWTGGVVSAIILSGMFTMLKLMLHV